METLNWLITAIQEQISSALTTMMGSILIWMILFFILGIVIIVLAKKKKMLQRSNGFWSFIAGLNYVYVPVLLLVLGGFLGAVRGAHKVSGNFIDTSTQPIVEYAQSYLPEIQTFINSQMGTYQGQHITVEDVIAGQLTKELDLDPTSYEYQAAFEINLTVINAYLTFADLPGSIDDLQGMDVTNLPPDVFYVLPNSLHDVCDGFFFFKYIAVWGMFFPFLMIPVAEYLIFIIFGDTKIQGVPLTPRAPQFPPIPQSDFV